MDQVRMNRHIYVTVYNLDELKNKIEVVTESLKRWFVDINTCLWSVTQEQSSFCLIVEYDSRSWVIHQHVAYPLQPTEWWRY
jgi:hypothetical protein